MYDTLFEYRPHLHYFRQQMHWRSSKWMAQDKYRRNKDQIIKVLVIIAGGYYKPTRELLSSQIATTNVPVSLLQDKIIP